MLIDEFLPTYQVVERHALLVPAPPARAYAAIWEADLAASPIVKALFALRSVPALLSAPRSFRFPASRVTLHELLRHGFHLLAEEPGREVVLGIVGRFWRLTGNVVPTDPAAFRQPLLPGTARAAWNFLVSETEHGSSLVSTETRVLCADDASLRSFRRYWFVVGHFSALTRILLLRSIRATAQRAT